MGELKAIGSEKLKGDEKIKRILDLTYYQSKNVLKESSKIVKESKSGIYGIVKEKDGYYVKKGLNENSLDYIGGMFMKNKNRFSSYAEALKKLEFLTEQENIQEATKYVLKQNKPAPPPETVAPPTTNPTGEAPIAPTTPPETDNVDDETGGDEDPNDYMKSLKKAAGTLQQKLNKYADRMESSNYKEIVNQVLSAINFDELEDTDRDEILDQIEGDDDESTSNSSADNGEVSPPQETAEIDGIASLDELINTPINEFGDDDYYPGDDDPDDFLKPFDDEFLNDPEISKAGKFAKNDLDQEFSDESDDESDHESDDEIPLYVPEKDIDEVSPIPGSPEDVKELDLDELTNIINGSVKETLGKYFQ